MTKFTRAQEENVSDPLPLDKHEEVVTGDNYRIWIGNMDPDLNEFSLLQLLKKFGKIKELDFLFHKTGPLQGKSRGFHFASFHSKIEAQNAIDGLNGKLILSKNIHVRWAHQQVAEKTTPVNINLKTDLVNDNKATLGQKGKQQTKTEISSIEKKLKEMETSTSRTNSASSSAGGLHPVLQQSKANKAVAEARKRTHPYRKPHGRKR